MGVFFYKLKQGTLKPIIWVLLLLALIAPFFAQRSFYTIASGHSGVIFHLFGGGVSTTETLEEGLHVQWPWDEITLYETRGQIFEYTGNVRTASGLQISLSLAVRFTIDASKLGYLHKEIGPNFRHVVIEPYLISLMREESGLYTEEEIYFSKRIELQEMVKEKLRSVLKIYYLNVDQLSIFKIALPDKVRSAIEDKLSEQQKFFNYAHKLKIAQQDIEKRRLEAQGIKEYNTILNRSLNDSFLTWKGIEATLELAKTTNKKVIVIGKAPIGSNFILGAAHGEQASGSKP